MPTFVHGKGTGIFLNQYNLSEYFNSIDTAQSVDVSESTGFGSTAKAYVVGLADGTLSMNGMWAADAGGSDAVLSSILGSSTTPIITVVFGTGTIGNSAIVAKASETNYSISTPVGDIVSVTADFQASTDATTNLKYGIRNGKILTTGNSIAFGSLGNLASVDNSASSANGGAGNLHVTANSITGGTTTIKIQHSTDNTTWADLITFTAVAASTATSQQSVVSGTVNRYLRATASTAGSAGAITFNVSFTRF